MPVHTKYNVDISHKQLCGFSKHDAVGYEMFL